MLKAFSFIASLLTAIPSGDITAKVQSIELEHTNPSMGPNETKVSYTLQAKDAAAEVKHLLEETQVNHAVSLKEYLALLQSNDSAKLNAVRQKYEPKSLSEGGTISHLKFHLQDGSTLELGDLRTYELSGYYETTFQALLVSKGSKYVSEPVSIFPPKPGPLLK